MTKTNYIQIDENEVARLRGVLADYELMRSSAGWEPTLVNGLTLDPNEQEDWNNEKLQDLNMQMSIKVIDEALELS